MFKTFRINKSFLSGRRRLTAYQVRWSLSGPFQNISENLVPTAWEVFKRDRWPGQKEVLLPNLIAGVIFGVSSVTVSCGQRGWVSGVGWEKDTGSLIGSLICSLLGIAKKFLEKSGEDQVSKTDFLWSAKPCFASTFKSPLENTVYFRR